MAKTPAGPKKPAKKTPIASAASNGPPPSTKPIMSPPRRVPARRPPPMPPVGMDTEDGMLGDDMGLMQPSPEERIAEWVETSVFPRNKHSATIQLCHWSMSGEQPVHEWPMAEEFAQEDPSSIAATVYGCAVEDAESQQSPSSRYSVRALDSTGRSFARVIVNIAREELDPGRTMGGESEERHTQEGHLAQSYRHTEQFARFALAMQLSTGRQNLELHRELGTTRTQLHQQQIQSVELFQNMKDREALRQIMIGKHKRTETMKDAALGLVMKFAPHIAQRIGLMTDDEAAQLQTTDAVADWLAVLPEDDARRMIQNTPDPAKRQAFERAWIVAKKRAAARAARAALSGTAPAQIAGGAAVGAAGTSTGSTAVAADKGMQFSKEESVPINQTTLIVLYLLLSVDEAIFTMVLPRIPEAAHAEIRALRERVRAEGDGALTQAVQLAAVVSLRPHVVKMLCEATPQDVMLMLSQVDNPGHKQTVREAHKLVQDKLKAAAA